ncbi:MAG TPA: hypothetical protein VFE14_18750 [Micromonosporaceae bacterium]|nr:hypothetical protein [Micromonosporaceae bacterium]
MTAAQWNASVRDNILVTPAALATATGRFFATTAANAIAERVPTGATVATSQTTGNTSYTNLTTVGPQVTVNTGTVAFGIWSCTFSNNTTPNTVLTSAAVSGATTVAASDSYCGRYLNAGIGTNAVHRGVGLHWWTGLTPGSNTFTQQYRVDGGTGAFSDRELWVLPF